MGTRWSILGLFGVAAACGEPPGDLDPDPTEGTSSATSPHSSTAVDDSGTLGTLGTWDPTVGTDTASTTEGGSDTQMRRCGALPDPDPPWLANQLDDTVARLSGAAELSPGITLTERSSPASRAATADALQTAFVDLGLETSRHDYSTTGSNVVGRLPATEPGSRSLVIGAHFDTVPGSPGANDNATGIAVVLALARHLGAMECRSHDVWFLGFDQEEVGFLGSRAFAQFLVDERIDVEAVHTIDQMGWDQDGDRAIELERADPGLFEFYESAAVSLDPPRPLTPTRTGFTDHVSFRAAGFAAVGITEEFVSGDTTPHYHLPSDTYETVNFEYLASTSILINEAFARFIDAG